MPNVNYHKVVEVLLRPFKKHFLCFIVLSAMTTCAHVIGYFTTKNTINLNAAIIIAMHCISLSYVVTLLISAIRQKTTRQILQTIFIFLAAIDFAINFYCAVYLHQLFDEDIALLIKDTDLNEAKEFFSSMIPMWIFLIVAGVFLLFFFLWLVIKRRNIRFDLGHKSSMLAMLLIGICMMGNLYNWNIWKLGPLGPFYTFSQNEDPTDLRLYFTHPDLTFEKNDESPTNVVLIVGESFSRSHSSIYGYDKLTNPKLTNLKENSLLYSFDSINSPAHSTVLSLRFTLSTYDLCNVKEDKKWYEYISLIELMKESGFDCYWFGNQGRIGMHNAATRVYAQACDYQWFLKKDNIEDQFDIVLVDSSYQYIKKISHKNHNFIVYHMKGSHFEYNKRYPNEFAQFSENDYSKDPHNHREILSSYDNSILYNDYIVNRIIDLFKESESVVIYLPDHGQVMFRNKKDPDHYAHGRKSDPVDYALGIDIPFFIYTSPLYQQRHLETMERIKNRQSNPKSWNSDELPYFIMDLIGVSAINGKSIADKSILN